MLAFDHASTAGALAWSTLLFINELDSLPDPDIPGMFKSSWSFRPYGGGGGTSTSELTALPNPASDRIAYTYPVGLEAGSLEIHDAQGRLVQRITLNGRAGMVESSVLTLEAGCYSARVLLDGIPMAAVKFNVVR